LDEPWLAKCPAPDLREREKWFGIIGWQCIFFAPAAYRCQDVKMDFKPPMSQLKDLLQMICRGAGKIV
jgi:hypothetical protein